ncbi:capsid protein [Sigmofec virus UA08Rod_19468]|uniref:Capsid protein n=1 Tax=Sigmofec virus UA08Rod_19468 TaxID=2929265 RepID=A0A976N0J5_9VIRU|nr:capsid protein [Sigmofec virus UA08Rod_19468]
MVWYRRYGRPRHRRYRLYGRHRYGRRFGRRRYSRRFTRRSTRSATVKLTYETSFTWAQADSTTFTVVHTPFNFNPVSIPGFSEYLTTYTQFRIKIARLRVSTISTTSAGLPSGAGVQGFNYLAVPSKPFAQGHPPIPQSSAQTPSAYLSTLLETDLRQSRFQRVLYPSAVTNQLKLSFVPYTFTSTFGPSSNTTSLVWQRPWSAKKWMPVTWVNSATAGLQFYGPYIARSSPSGDSSVASWQSGVTLELYLQFKGQH